MTEGSGSAVQAPPSPAVKFETIEEIQSRLADVALIAAALVGAVVLPASLLRASAVGWRDVMFLHVAVYALLLAMALLRRHLSLALRALFLIILAPLLAIFGLMTWGLVGMAVPILLTWCVIVAILTNLRASVAAIITSVSIIAIVGVALQLEWIAFHFDVYAYATAPVSWLVAALTTGMCTAAIAVGVSKMHQSLRRSMDILKDRSAQLEQSNVQLEEEIRVRKRAEGSLRDSEERFRAIFNQTFQFMGLLSLDGTILALNDQALEFLDTRESELLGKPLWATSWWTHSPELQERVRQGIVQAAAGSFVRFETTHPDEHGGVLTIDFSVKPVRNQAGEVVFLIPEGRDISDLKNAQAEQARLEGQLHHAQKMEAVGQLAGGVAHDFNNLLQAIQGYTSIALEKLPAAAPARESLNEVIKATWRAAALVRQLLTFSRREAMQPEYTDLNDLVGGLVTMLHRLIGEHIELVTRAGFELHTVYVDPGQFEQVLMNLCVNARDAMPHGGRITIETQNTHVDPAFCQRHPWAVEGEYAVLSVSDTGVGIPADIQERVFEPFFTTKEVGQGTGLGLATVYAIVKRHAGFVHLYSESGKGTTFRIYLPATASPQSAQTEQASVLTDDIGGNETILLAEDDQQVRDVAAEILEAAGYRVLVARDGEEATELASQYRDDIHIAVLDVVMPKKSGRDVYDSILGLGLNIPVLFSSGYSYAILEEGDLVAGGLELIQKPFDRIGLLRKVREMLGPRPSPTP